MEQNTQHLLNISRKVLELTRQGNSEGITRDLEAAIRDLEENPHAIVQLYSVSQAGKSTLFSMLTRGEQYVPIGLGKATTAVVIELISVSAPEKEKAEVMWLSPHDLLSLVVEPLKPYLPRQDKAGHDGQHQTAAGALMPSEAHPDFSTFQSNALADPAKFRMLVRALVKAHRFRQVETGKVSQSNDLAVAEVILRHYFTYVENYREGFSQVPIDELHHWTRQPYDWESKPLKRFTFDELRCFFIKKVRLYTQTHPMIEGMRIIDAPGFGVSSLHDHISRGVQEKADGVLLLLGASGSEITNAQLHQIQQLAEGVRDNLFVLWNPKSGTKYLAEDLLAGDLEKMRQAGVRVPAERATIANLLLALRSIQWQKFTNTPPDLLPVTIHSLSEIAPSVIGPQKKPPDSEHDRAKMVLKKQLKSTFHVFVGDPDDELSDSGTDTIAQAGLEQSGWMDAIPTLFSTIRATCKNRRISTCVEKTIQAIGFYVAQFPIPDELEDIKKNIESLKGLIDNFDSKANTTVENLLEAISKNLVVLLRDLVSFLTDKQQVNNLHDSLLGIIDKEVNFSVVPTKIQARIKDHLETRCGVWCGKVRNFESTDSKISIRIKYETSVSKFQEWITDCTRQYGRPMRLDIPPSTLPNMDFSDFRQEFSLAIDKVVEKTFTPDFIDQCVTWLTETGHDILEAGKGWWNKTVSFITGEKASKTPPRHRYDKAKAKDQVAIDLKGLFQKETLEFILLVDRAAYAKVSFGERMWAALEASTEKPVSSSQALLDRHFATPEQEFIQAAENIGQILHRTEEIIRKRREKLLASGRGPIFKFCQAVLDTVEKNFNDWGAATKTTLVNLYDNLVKQEEGFPSPLSVDTVADLENLLTELTGFAEKETDRVIQLNHAKEVLAARRVKTATAPAPQP